MRDIHGIKSMKKKIFHLITVLSVLFAVLGVYAVTASAINQGSEPVTEYPLRIGETRVTENNKDNIAFEEGFAKYVPETNTLILNNVSKKNEDANGKKDSSVSDPLWYILYEGTDSALNIELVGTNYFDCQNNFLNSINHDVVFKGTGTLTVNCIGPGSGVYVLENLVIEEGCTVNISLTQGTGFTTAGDLTCNGTAEVTGAYDHETNGVVCRGKVLITGMFSADSISGYGIQAVGQSGTVEINKALVYVNGILVEEGTLKISNRSAVETNAKYKTANGQSAPLYGLCAAKGITILDSMVSATSDMTTAIHCENPGSGDANIIIKNSIVTAKSVPKSNETKCPGKGIFVKEGEISLEYSDVTAEGSEGIYTEWGAVTITGGTVTADGKESSTNNYTDKGCGVYVGYGDLTLTDATLTAGGSTNGIFVSTDSYIQNGGEVVCKGALGAQKDIKILPGVYTQAEPKFTVEAEGAECAAYSWDLYVASGTVSVKGGIFGVFIVSNDPARVGLTVENTATKVVIEGTTQAVLLNQNNVEKKIILGSEFVIREPENGKVSGDKHNFLNANDSVAKKVVLVKTYGITFDANGGGGAMAATTADSGGEYELPECGFTAPEHQGFDCWLVGDEEHMAGDKIAVTADTVLKAKWKHVHSLSPVAAQPATCTDPGHSAYYTCAGCDLWFEDAEGKKEITDHSSVILKANGHTEVVDPAVPATCLNTGLTEGKHCSACGTVLVAQETVPALGHDWGAWKVTKEATAEHEGEETRVCSRDPEHKETRAIPKLNEEKTTEAEPEATTEAETKAETETEATTEAETEAETAAETEPESEAETEAETEPESEAEKESEPEAEPGQEPEAPSKGIPVWLPILVSLAVVGAIVGAVLIIRGRRKKS